MSRGAVLIRGQDEEYPQAKDYFTSFCSTASGGSDGSGGSGVISSGVAASTTVAQSG